MTQEVWFKQRSIRGNGRRTQLRLERLSIKGAWLWLERLSSDIELPERPDHAPVKRPELPERLDVIWRCCCSFSSTRLLILLTNASDRPPRACKVAGATSPARTRAMILAVTCLCWLLRGTCTVQFCTSSRAHMSNVLAPRVLFSLESNASCLHPHSFPQL